MSADFTPPLKPYSDINKFRFWCQKVLPLVYDDSLSYYELLNKVVDYLNRVIDNMDNVEDNVKSLYDAFVELQNYVNDYFDSQDWQSMVNNKIDQLVIDGYFEEIIEPLVTEDFNRLITELNAFKEEVNDEIDAFKEDVNSSIQSQNENISVLEARMDTFASLTEGSTTGDAELIDIRVEYNGNIAATAGDAVRNQVGTLTEITDDIESLFNNRDFDWRDGGSSQFPNGWRAGYYDRDSGVAYQDNVRHTMRTRFIMDKTETGENSAFFIVTPPEGHYIRVAVRNSEQVLLKTYNYNNVVDYKVTVPIVENQQYCFTCGYYEDAVASVQSWDEIKEIKLQIYDKLYLPKTYNDKGNGSYIWDNELKYAIAFPSTYSTQNEKTPLVVICHGLSAQVDQNNWTSYSISQIFTNAGYAVLDVDQITAADWCNPALIERYYNAVNDAIIKYNIYIKYIYGYSMGSLIGLCLSNIFKVKASIISGIRLDLAARYELMDETSKAIVDTNLGFTDGYNAYECSGYNPTAYDCIDINNNNINPVSFSPVLFMYGNADTNTTAESILKAQAIKRGGTIATIKEYVGNHHTMCFLEAAGSATDALAWFEKWK